jgi:dihydroxyacetone kinase
MINALQLALQALPEGLNLAAQAARRGAFATALITKAKAGRAAYMPEENLIGHNDPGAEAVALVFEGLADGA